MGAVQSVLRWGVVYPSNYMLDVLQGIGRQHSQFLLGNFAPVESEVTSTHLDVQGVIPEDLVGGEFVRNGPNPRYVPRGGYHWFDGDGMLHGVKLNRESVAYFNRWVRTYRFTEEERQRGKVWLRLGEMHGKLGLLKIMLAQAQRMLGLVRGNDGDGTANTALQFHDGKLLALVENDAPYIVRLLQDGQLETIARHTYDNKLRHPFTAHPKIDSETGEMMIFGYRLLEAPHCVYSVIDANGVLLRSVDIGLQQPVMMHDCSITRNYTLILDFPLEFHPKRIVHGSVWYFNTGRPSRIGVIPRHSSSASDILWFEFQPCYVFHVINSWEEGDDIVLHACRLPRITLDDLGVNDESRFVDDKPAPYEFRMNLKSRKTSERPLSPVHCEFPVVNPKTVGRKSRCTFAATFDNAPRTPVFNGVSKLWLNDAGTYDEVGRIEYGANKFGGECTFVPRRDASDEDDGYLMTYVCDESAMTSEFWIMNAKTMDPTPIAKVALPQRVPYGFHGLYVSAEQIAAQHV